MITTKPPTIELWYYNLSEKERRAMIGDFPGAMEYGLTRIFGKLPREAVTYLQRVYEGTYCKRCGHDRLLHENAHGPCNVRDSDSHCVCYAWEGPE